MAENKKINAKECFRCGTNYLPFSMWVFVCVGKSLCFSGAPKQNKILISRGREREVNAAYDRLEWVREEKRIVLRHASDYNIPSCSAGLRGFLKWN